MVSHIELVRRQISLVSRLLYSSIHEVEKPASLSRLSFAWLPGRLKIGDTGPRTLQATPDTYNESMPVPDYPLDVVPRRSCPIPSKRDALRYRPDATRHLPEGDRPGNQAPAHRPAGSGVYGRERGGRGSNAAPWSTRRHPTRRVTCFWTPTSSNR